MKILIMQKDIFYTVRKLQQSSKLVTPHSEFNSHHLEQIKLKVVRFGDVHQSRVVGRLTADFYQLELNICVLCRRHEHLHEKLIVHKV